MKIPQNTLEKSDKTTFLVLIDKKTAIKIGIIDNTPYETI